MHEKNAALLGLQLERDQLASNLQSSQSKVRALLLGSETNTEMNSPEIPLDSSVETMLLQKNRQLQSQNTQLKVRRFYRSSMSDVQRLTLVVVILHVSPRSELRNCKWN